MQGAIHKTEGVRRCIERVKVFRLNALKMTELEICVITLLYVPSFNGVLEIFVAPPALGIFKSVMAAGEYFKRCLNYVLRGGKQ